MAVKGGFQSTVNHGEQHLRRIAQMSQQAG
jgi:hypothetical protein